MSTSVQYIPIYVILGQIGLFAGIFISFLLMPSFLATGGGISNYGILPETVRYYSLGFLSAAVSCLLAGLALGRSTKKSERRNSLAHQLQRTLVKLAIGYLLVLISTYPYKLHPVYTAVHEMISGTFFIYMAFLGFRWSRQLPTPLSRTIVRTGLSVSLGLAVATFLGLIHMLFIGEIFTGIIFGSILVRILRLQSRVLEQRQSLMLGQVKTTTALSKPSFTV